MAEQKLKNEFFDFFQNKSFEDIEREYNEHKLNEKNNTQPANQHQKQWEILFGLYLKEKLKDAFCRSAGQGRPDFLYTKDNKKFWFECIASEKPKLKEEDQYWQPKECTNEPVTPENLFDGYVNIGDTLRPYQLCYYQMLQEKEKQCKNRIEKGIINKNDFNILCLNGYLFEQNDFFTQESNLYYETFCGRKIYQHIAEGTALGKLCSVLFRPIRVSDYFKIDERNGSYFERPFGGKFINKTKNGDEIYQFKDGYYRYVDENSCNIYKLARIDIAEEDVKRDYLQCNFFCREDFPFNGILFSNLSYKWKNTKLTSIKIETGEQAFYNKYSLYYLQNPMKESCIKYFENLCECINCDVFYQDVMLF